MHTALSKSSASFGKQQEFSAIAKLVSEDFDVYVTLIDNKQIDCILRLPNRKYLDIQIKARSKDAKQSHTFAPLSFKARKNFYFVFYTEKSGDYWIMPSRSVRVFGKINKGGKNVDKVTLRIPPSTRSIKWNIFQRYRNEKGFSLLRAYR
ncbi:MAG TPA: hypothetical protein VNL73_04220 [Verrucomicrobiae bacterium]|nr:hypothetical protein [Verrucomicrobiae bacterium]